MKAPLLITALVVVSVIALLLVQQRSILLARAENRSLQQQAHQFTFRREAQAHRQKRQDLADELAQLRKDHDELTRLRAEAGSSPDQPVTPEGQRLLDQAGTRLAAAQAATTLIREKIAAEELRLKRTDDMKNLGLAARTFAIQHQDRFPMSFEQLTNQLPADFDFGLYEFVEHSRPLTEKDRDLILFREKAPRQLPIGGWIRSYTMVNGSVQQVGSDTGDYKEWERPRLAQPDATALSTLKP